jgi:AcrR family transcriptional regulator
VDSIEEPVTGENEEVSAVETEGQAAERPLRRDAERNRQRILRAADEIFTQRGLEATLDDVARHAGVGVGTVYRRFPDKTSLVDALFEQRVDALVEMAEHAYAQPDAWQALVWFLEQAAEKLSGDRGLRQLLMFAAAGHDRVDYARNRMKPAVDRLLKRAQAEGQVREDLGATDMPVLEFMIGAVAEYAHAVRPDLWRRFLALMLDALRPARDSYTQLPVRELTPEEMVTVMRTSPLGRHLGTHKTPGPQDP